MRSSVAYALALSSFPSMSPHPRYKKDAKNRWHATRFRAGCTSHFLINFAVLRELCSLFFHSTFYRRFVTQSFFSRVTTHIFRDAHAAEVRSTHTAKVGCLGTFLRQGLVVEFAGGFEIKREIKLIFPAEFEACFADSVVAVLRAGMAFR